MVAILEKGLYFPVVLFIIYNVGKIHLNINSHVMYRQFVPVSRLTHFCQIFLWF